MATIIDRETAKKLIAEYKEQNTAASGPALKTPDGKNLEGFFLDIETLQTILGNPDCDGIHIMLAKDPNFIGSKENIFNILIMESNTGSDSDITTEVTNADIYGPTPTCPHVCPPALD